MEVTLSDKIVIGIAAGLVLFLLVCLFVIGELMTRSRKQKEKLAQTEREKEALENAQKKKHEIRTGDHSHDITTMADIVHQYAK